MEKNLKDLWAQGVKKINTRKQSSPKKFQSVKAEIPVELKVYQEPPFKPKPVSKKEMARQKAKETRLKYRNKKLIGKDRDPEYELKRNKRMEEYTNLIFKRK
jgi:hypothetical protein